MSEAVTSIEKSEKLTFILLRMETTSMPVQPARDASMSLFGLGPEWELCSSLLSRGTLNPSILEVNDIPLLKLVFTSCCIMVVGFSGEICRFSTSLPVFCKNSSNETLFVNKNAYLCRPKFRNMARVCQLTGKKPITGNKVSHSNIKTKRRFLPNLQTKRYFLAEEDKWVTIKVSSEAIRTINKNGLYSVVKQLRAAGEKI